MHFRAEQRGAHIIVDVRGAGEPGQRPLLGTLTMSPGTLTMSPDEYRTWETMFAAYGIVIRLNDIAKQHPGGQLEHALEQARKAVP